MSKELFTSSTQQVVSRLVAKSGKSQTYYERKARRMIKQMLEDEEDYLIALERFNNNEPTLTLEELEKELELENYF